MHQFRKRIRENVFKIGGLSKATGVRQSTLKYYSDIGILPYEQKETRLARWYDKNEVMKRLQEIQKLKKRGLAIKKIVKQF